MPQAAQSKQFQLESSFQPTGDQPQAIEQLVAGIKAGAKHQVLLGVTGSGKTFTTANVIAKLQRPTLVISHNKTLAAQLFQEYREFFPKNAVEYFVSYYDYYQPEAYLPQTDTYIEKDSAINEDIDKLRLAATTSLLTRRDVIVVASVSCIYNLGSPVEYKQLTLTLKEGMPLRREDLLARLVQLFYTRSDIEFKPGVFRVKGEIVDIWPAYQDWALRLELHDNLLRKLKLINPLTGRKHKPASVDSSQIIKFGEFTLYPAKHYITSEKSREQALKQIRTDLAKQLKKLRRSGRELEAYRLEQKTNYDLELIEELGYCKGIENYSRYFDGRKPGEPPYTLIDFFPEDFLIVIDESHITVPQIRGMYNGDQARKQTLIDYGFRLPSALDNRPLKLEEFLQKANQIIYTSATPGHWELNRARRASKQLASNNSPSGYHPGIVEQLIRPTGLLDPEIIVRGTQGQIENLISEITQRAKKGERTLVTTLTKRMAEDLSNYLREQGISVHYLHADVNTLDRSEILQNLRRGDYDVVVGINLLREGLDLPEVSLVAILDADKEGFLRSATSLIQTMGRAARHINGKVIMYADHVTGSMQQAIDEVNRRRKVQKQYNQEHRIRPATIKKPFRKQLIKRATDHKEQETKKGLAYPANELLDQTTLPESIEKLKAEMKLAAEELNFERAALLRDQIEQLERTKTHSDTRRV